MVEEQLDSGSTECKFPNVRKTFWRSATWNSHSAPKLQPLQGQESEAPPPPPTVPLTPRSLHHQQTTKSRASLPPLQPLAIARRSLEEWPKAGLDDMSDWSTPATPGRRRVRTGPDIKLDLASVHRSSVEPTEIQLKRDKFAHFDKECSRVADYHIYLGSDAVARNRDTLRANGITHVLNCVGFVCPEYFKRDLVYKTLWLQDSPCEDITSLLYDVFDYFEEVKEQGGRVFVHCCQGVSRSTSLVIAYLMWKEGRSFEDALQDVKAARGITNPNMGFACQLLQCQKRVHAAPMSPNSVLRMYRLTPHSPYDPLHLVPKTVNNPGAADLDSRGAFVIHVPLAIYVWIGQDCDPKMAQAAKGAAGQVVRYERAQGPVFIFAEGQEDPEFWESLCKYAAPSDESSKSAAVSIESLEEGDKMDEGQMELESEVETRRGRPGRFQVERVRKLGVGNRKVPAYDVDFELYRRARQGGVVPPVPSTGVGIATVPTRVPAREDGWGLLRRKFLLGELVKPKETVIIEKPNPNPLSPDSSMSSSSPHFSPFSVTSSSSGAAGSDSPFASPLSFLSNNPSPNTLQANSPCSSQVSSSPDSCSSNPSPLRVSLPPFPTNSKPFAPQHAGKSPGTSLAQRRGTVSPSLRLPGLEDDPPPAPRGMSRKPRLPPLVMVEKWKVEKGAEENGDRGVMLDGLNELCGLVDENSGAHGTDFEDLFFSTPVNQLGSLSPSTVQEQALTDDQAQSEPLDDSRGEHDDQVQCELHIESSSFAVVSQPLHRKSASEAVLESGHPALYAWPALVRIDMFDADDLDTRAVFVLLAPQAEGIGHGTVVYVWVGKENGNGNGEGEATWLQVGHDFLQQMQLWSDTPIRVVRERQEPEEFWENFNHG